MCCVVYLWAIYFMFVHFVFHFTLRVCFTAETELRHVWVFYQWHKRDIQPWYESLWINIKRRVFPAQSAKQLEDRNRMTISKCFRVKTVCVHRIRWRAWMLGVMIRWMLNVMIISVFRQEYRYFWIIRDALLSLSLRPVNNQSSAK